jgi:hypothetical protein
MDGRLAVERDAPAYRGPMENRQGAAGGQPCVGGVKMM